MTEPIQILVVEDESLISRDIQLKLRRLGYRIAGAAASAQQAIDRAHLKRPDLVLMDINLRGDRDGIDAAGTIRREYNIPVVFLTSFADDATISRAKRTEPYGYLLKPVDDAELQIVIEMALYKHQLETRLRDSEERYALAARGTNDGLWDWDLCNNTVFYSPRWRKMLGLEETTLLGDPEVWLGRVHPADSARVRDAIEAHIGADEGGPIKQGHFECEYRIQMADGSYRWMLSRGMAQRDDQGVAHRMAGSQTDLTERRIYDPLTGLPVASLFRRLLSMTLERADRQGRQMAVLAVGLDRFSAVNQSLGLAAGDAVLAASAQRLSALIRRGEPLCRFANDEFLVLVDDISNDFSNVEGLESMAERIISCLERPFEVDDGECAISASVGIALSGEQGLSAEDLLARAETALRRAKASGGGQATVFVDGWQEETRVRMQLLMALRRAIQNDELSLHYQPLISMRTGRITGMEALLRWIFPGRGPISPGLFIPIAEETGLILPIGEWVIGEVCRQIREWRDDLDLTSSLAININVSGLQFTETDLVAVLTEAMEKYRIDPSWIKVEITESALIGNPDLARDCLLKIRNMGIAISMDDFGTGYSSLSYLHRFPVDTLKIDRSFVHNIGSEDGAEALAVARTIIALARELHMNVTAEGIETAEQFKMLERMGCDFGQGWFFARAYPPSEARKLLELDPVWDSSGERTALDRDEEHEVPPALSLDESASPTL